MQQQQQFPNLQQLQGQLLQQQIVRLEQQQLEQQLLQQHGSPLLPVQAVRPQNHLQRYTDRDQQAPRQPPVLFPPHLQRIQAQLVRHEQEELILRRALLAVHADHSGSGNLAGPLGGMGGESLLRDAAHQGLPIGGIPGLVAPPGRTPGLMPQAGDTADWEEGFASGVRSGGAGAAQAGSLAGGGAADGRYGFPFHGMRVLVVDDEPLCLVILERMLQRCHYQVTTCNRARTALNILRERPGDFDLVISDVHMPDMDGFKLLEAIGLELDLPVIMMSADRQTDVVMKGVIHGAVDYLVKPVRIEELRNLWQHVLRRRPHWGSKRHLATEVHSTTGDEDRMSSENDECVKMSSGDEGDRASARMGQQLMHQRQATGSAGAAALQAQLASGQAPASLLLAQAGAGTSPSVLAATMGIGSEFAGAGAAGGGVLAAQQQRQVAAVQEPEAGGDAGSVAQVKRKCTWGGEDEGTSMSAPEGYQKPYEVGVGGLKKARIIWDVHLHQQFVNAVKKLGVDKAVPKKILDLMNVEGLSRENVASHLQKYRLYLKRLSAVADAQAKHRDGGGGGAKDGKDAGPSSGFFQGIKDEPGFEEFPAVKEEHTAEPAESWEEGAGAALPQVSEGRGTAGALEVALQAGASSASTGLAGEREQRPAGGHVAPNQVASRVQKDSPASSSRAPQAVAPLQLSGAPRVLPELLQPGEGPAGMPGQLAEELQRHAALRAQLTSLEYNEMLLCLQQQQQQTQARGAGAAPLLAVASLRLGQGQTAVGAAAGQGVDGLLQQYRQTAQEKAATQPRSVGEEELGAGGSNSELEILQRLHEQQQQLLELHQRQLQMLAKIQGQGGTSQGLEGEGAAGPSSLPGNQGATRSTAHAAWEGTADLGTLAPPRVPGQNSGQEARAAEANAGFEAQAQHEQPEQPQEALRGAPVGSPLGAGSDTEDLFNLLWRQDSVNLDGLE